MRRCLFLCLVVIICHATVLAEHSSRIKHIVVLMMENRSFDNLLGWLKRDKNAKIDGLTGSEKLPRDPKDLSKGFVPVTRGGYDISPDDPKHTFDEIAIQINGDKMNGFVFDSLSYKQNETNPVSMFDHRSAPIINTLADEFAVFDRWFCSIPTSTDPNRAFAMSGTSQGVLTNYNGTRWTQQSYLDYLREHNRTYAGYYQDDVWVFGYFEDMQTAEVASHIHLLDQHFFADAAAGTLPAFSWLQPRSSTISPTRTPTWQHPDASVALGEELIKQVYEALRAGPGWEDTLLLITYDEHGGFYDHVAPPRHGVPAPDASVADNGFAFDQLGIRVPTLAISPWIAKGRLVHDALPNERPTRFSQFESTSIMATANILLGLKDEGAAPLGERMAWANTFAGLFDELPYPRSDCPMQLPALPVDPNPTASFEAQRAKPLNEHMEGMLLFFCVEHYPELQAKDMCPGRKQVMHNQGLASDWLAQETARYREKVGLGRPFKLA